jgi:hypothetical protein
MFKVIFSSDYYEPDKSTSPDECCLAWHSEQSDETVSSKVIEVKTKEEAQAVIENNAYNGVWDSIRVEEKDGNEIYEDTVIRRKCECCGHEEFDRLTSDLGYSLPGRGLYR